MVQINPLLYAIPVLSRFAPLDSTSSGLVIRQSIDPSSLPSACQSSCQAVMSVASTNCDTDPSCMCASTIGSELQQCMSCLVNADPTIQSEAQTDISGWNEACNGNLTLSGGSSSGGTTTTVGTTSGTTGGTTSGTTPATTTGTSSSGGSGANPLVPSGGVGLKTSGSMTVCMVAALVGAFISL